MMNTLRLVSRQNVCRLRFFHKGNVCRTEVVAAKIETMTVPPPEGIDKPVSPKIDKLVNDITALNLIEVAELSEVLKKRLNLPDASLMPMGGFVAGKQEEEEEVVQQKVQTSFTVKLMKFDDKQKVALIKEMKSILPDTNLVQAKKFVESAPVVVKADISKEEAEALKASIVKVGGEVEIS
ncbi:hypothetical protein KM043_017387 [Ampulex compressa]|nr:hypothetical protein KM043_017387 [Ampulex compressa]